jgi:AAHS family 3-hydroxyphenylpropionic acid transporter
LQAAGVAAGGIVAEFHPSPSELGSFFSASTLGLFVFALVGGRIADSLGRRRTLALSVLLFGIFSIATAGALTMHQLSAARLLTGAGLGGALPNLIALVNESSSQRRRNANVALVYSAMPFGGAFASGLSMLMPAAHWRAIFIVGGVVPLLLVPLLYIVVPESPEFRRLQSTPERRPSVGALFSGGRAMRTILMWLSSFLVLLALYTLLNWMPTLLMEAGLSKSQAAGEQIAFNIGGGVTALLVGQLLESRFKYGTVVAVFATAPLFVLLLSRSLDSPHTIAWIVFALGGSIIAAQGYIYASAPHCYPTVIRAFGVGSVVAMGRLGSIVGPKVAGLLRESGQGSAQLLMDLLPILALGGACALVFAWMTRRID